MVDWSLARVERGHVRKSRLRFRASALRPRSSIKLRTACNSIGPCKDISFHDIAAHLKMSAFHFARMFKHSTGHSPHQYIVRCRVNRAKELLAETKLPITDVAFEVGCKTQSHFTTSFSRPVGVTPAAFRAGK